MESLLPLAIGIGVGLAFLLLRRAIVTRVSNRRRPATTDTSAEGDGSKFRVAARIPSATGAPPQVTDEVLRDILRQAEAMPSGTKEGTLWKGNTRVQWTVNKQVTVLQTGKGLDGANMPEETRLQYPGSTFVVAHVPNTQSSVGSSEVSGGAYSTTLASSADHEQIAAWYRDWLLSHGWQPGAFSGTSPAPTLECVRGSEYFRLVLSDPSTVAPVLAIPIPEGTKTVFKIEYSTPIPPSP